MRYQTVYFAMGGLQMEGILISKGKRYCKIKMFFSGNVYRVKATKVFTKRWVRES